MRRALVALALLAALLPLPALATDYTRYVDAGASPGGDGSSGSPFQSIVQAEADASVPANLTTNGDNYYIICGGTSADTSEVYFDGFTLSATSKIYIRAADASRAGTVWSTSKYRLSLDPVSASLHMADTYYEIDGLQVENGETTTGGTYAFNSTGGGTFAVVKNCFFRSTYTGTTFNASVMQFNSAISGGLTMFNTILLNSCPRINNSNYTFYTGAGTHSIYSCTIIGGRYPFRVAGGTLTVKNVYAGNGLTTDYYVSAGTVTYTNCASEDTSASGTGEVDSVAYATGSGAYFTAVTNDGTQDLSISSASSGLRNVGVDTSGEGAPLNFATDIRGYTRVTTWDIGVFDYDGTAPSAGGGAVWWHTNEVMQ